MRLIKLIAPATLIATLALLTPQANAQTMGEYATTTAGVGTGGGSMGTSIGNTVGSDDLGSRTWGASSLGASFDERAGAASASAGGADFDSRAGSMTGGSASASRWPATSPLESGDGSNRFSDSNRFQDQDRFPTRTDLSDSSNRFPPGVLDQNRQGLDSHYSSSGLDNGYSSSSGLDNSYSSN
jgi:hypothetical protein